MPDEPGDEQERLRQENADIHRANLELLLRQSELTHENRQLWAFVLTSKAFQEVLQKEDFHSDTVEYIDFLTSFARLRQWLQVRLEELEQEADRGTA